MVVGERDAVDLLRSLSSATVATSIWTMPSCVRCRNSRVIRKKPENNEYISNMCRSWPDLDLDSADPSADHGTYVIPKSGATFICG
jgi:hypothetical protein